MQAPTSQHPIFHKHQALIEKASQIEVARLGASPIRPEEQDKSKAYWGDYEVLEVKFLSPEEALAYQKAALDTSQYLNEQKKCPFQAQYGLRFSKKEQHITLVLAASGCEKVILLSSHKDIDQKHYDLKAESALYALWVN
ncbi:MAG: hypothetical protein HC913_10820 [Microscillaceae bacterium]|nr:hypothetical protein [Microscillaceae bacterium]